MKTSKTSKPNKTRPSAMPHHQSFKLTKKRLKQSKPIPSGWTLIKQTVHLFRDHIRPLGTIVLISLVMSFVFVQGFSVSPNIDQIKTDVEDLLGSDTNTISSSLAVFSYMLGSAGSSSGQAGGAYQLFVVLIVSLATIWLVRQLLADVRPRAREAFYKGMYPLIPFLLVVAVIGLQLLPMLLGNLLFSAVINNGLAATAAEKILWGLLFALLSLLSLYMIASSLFALYIVTLPDMTPMKALRSARELVLHRRLGIWLRIIVLPLVLLLLAAVLVVPMLIVATPIAQILFLLMGAASLIIFHAYMYILYRSLL